MSDDDEGYSPPALKYNLPEGPSEDFFKFRIDGSDILDEIGHHLKGETYDYNSGEYIQKFDRWINDEGINKILHVIYACGINKNVFLGNLTKEEIMFKCKMIKKKMALLFFKKYKDYQVKKEMRDLLIATVVNPIHSALSRSEEGKESDQISTASQRHEIYNQQQQPEKKGMLGKFSFFGRNN